MANASQVGSAGGKAVHCCMLLHAVDTPYLSIFPSCSADEHVDAVSLKVIFYHTAFGGYPPIR
jgi:hypothetical protein